MAAEWAPFAFLPVEFSADGTGAPISVPDNPNWYVHEADLMGVPPCEQAGRAWSLPPFPPPPPPPAPPWVG